MEVKSRDFIYIYIYIYIYPYYLVSWKRIRVVRIVEYVDEDLNVKEGVVVGKMKGSMCEVRV